MSTKSPKLVASTSNDEAIQSLCAYERKRAHKRKRVKKSYILTCWGFKKAILREEFEDYLSKGLTDLVRIEYV